MNLETTAWILSIGGAVAFVAAGYLVGRVAARPRALAMAGGPDVRSVPALSALGRGPAAPSRRRDGTYREDRLVASLARLDPGDGSIDQIVLVDEQGLPCASTDDRLDADQLAAVGAQALGLLARVGETLARSRAVGIDLEDGRVLDVRPFGVDDATYYAVSVGRRRVDATLFETVADELRRVLGH